MDEVRVPIDEAHTQAWTEVALSARMDSHVLRSVPPDPADSSAFAQVNRLYPYEKVSDRARSYVNAALEHLLFWADFAAPLKFDPEHAVVFTMRPAHTLARAAIEASAQATWLMGTRDPLECIRRHICLVRWDLQEHRKSQADKAFKDAASGKDEELLARVSQVFQPEQVRPPNGYLAVIRAACEVPDVDLDANDLERLWRAASGAAHGMYWPTVHLNRVVPGEEYEPGQRRAVTTPDPAMMAEVLTAARTLAGHATLRFADYMGCDLAPLLTNARDFIAGAIPLKPGVSRDDVTARLRDYS